MFHVLVYKASAGGGGGGNFPAGITSGVPADAIVNANITGLDVRAFLEAFNGTTQDRLRVSSVATLTAATQEFSLLTTIPAQWTAFDTPLVSVQATCTRAAGGAGIHHVCTSLYAYVRPVVAQGQIFVNLRDGATGAGTILWSASVPTGAGQQAVVVMLPGLQIVGSANTAMTWEFSAAPTATNFLSVAMTGYSTI